ALVQRAVLPERAPQLRPEAVRALLMPAQTAVAEQRIRKVEVVVEGKRLGAAVHVAEQDVEVGRRGAGAEFCDVHAAGHGRRYRVQGPDAALYRYHHVRMVVVW